MRAHCDSCRIYWPHARTTRCEFCHSPLRMELRYDPYDLYPPPPPVSKNTMMETAESCPDCQRYLRQLGMGAS